MFREPADHTHLCAQQGTAVLNKLAQGKMFQGFTESHQMGLKRIFPFRAPLSLCVRSLSNLFLLQARGISAKFRVGERDPQNGKDFH